MRHALSAAIFTILIVACSSIKEEPDTRPSFSLDKTKPFVIELGRGSGWHGLVMVRIDETGLVTLRKTEQFTTHGPIFESASLQIALADLAALVDNVNSRRLTRMARSYSDPKVQDGTRWVLWIQQSPHDKSIYFNNAFPKQIAAFAGDLDAALRKAGLGTAVWTPAPKEGRDAHEALWSRIR